MRLWKNVHCKQLSHLLVVQKLTHSNILPSCGLCLTYKVTILWDAHYAEVRVCKAFMLFWKREDTSLLVQYSFVAWTRMSQLLHSQAPEKLMHVSKTRTGVPMRAHPTTCVEFDETPPSVAQLGMRCRTEDDIIKTHPNSQNVRVIFRYVICITKMYHFFRVITKFFAGEILWNFCVIFIPNVTIYSKTFKMYSKKCQQF